MSSSRRRVYSALAALATVAGLVAVVPTEAIATAGVPDHLTFTLQPVNGTVDGTIHVTVEVRDDADALVGDSTDQISLTLNTGSFDVGTTSLPAGGGVADFTGLEIHTPGSYTITATDDTSTGVTGTSDNFTLTHGVVTHLAFTTAPPATGRATGQIGATVQALDQYDNPVNGENISMSPFDAGTTTGTTSGNGEASFSGLEIHTVGPYTITAQDTSTTTATDATSGITITPGPPHHLGFETQPSDQYSEIPIAAFTVKVFDTYGNLVDDDPEDINVTLNTGEFSGGTDTHSTVNGIATFGDLTVLAPASYTITAHDTSTTGVTDATSNSFDILPHADLQLTMSSSGNDVAGLDQTYTVHVANFGPNANVSYEVTAALPSDVTFNAGASNGDCTFGGGNITCTRTVGIASTASDEFDIVLAVPSNYSVGVATRELSLTADLTATDPTQDPTNSDPNGATVTHQIHAEADLGVTSVSSSLPADAPSWQSGPIAGTDQLFSATVQNFGPSDNEGYTFHLNVAGLADPGGVTLVSAEADGSPITCGTDDANDTVDCVRPGLALNASATIVVRLSIDPGYTDPNTSKSLSYTASVGELTPGQGASPSHSDSAGDSITVNAAADLGVTGAASSVPSGAPSWQTGAVAGTDQLFSATVTNNGPSNNESYTFRLNVPDLGGGGGVSYVSAKSGATTITCAADNTNHNVNCDRPGLAFNGSETITVRLSIAPSYDNPNNSKSLAFTASAVNLSPSDQGADNTGANDASSSSVSVARVADLGIDVTFEQAGPTVYSGHDAVAGTDEIFHMTTHDYGPSDNGGFTATLTVADYDGTKLTLVSAPAGCTGNTGAHTVTCIFPITSTLAATADKTYDITFHISPSYTNPSTTKVLNYSAALSGLNPTAEGAATHANSTGSQSLNVDSVADVSDVSVTQTAVEETATTFNALAPGNRNTVLYTVTVSNHGPSDAYGVTINETLPSATLQIGSITYCTGSGCTPTTAYTNNTPILLGTIAFNTSSVVRFRAPLVASLRRGGAASLPSGNATAVTATTSNDPNGANNTSNLSINLFTVPDAPTIQQVQPGDKKIGVQWQDPADGGSSITGYDFIANGTAYFVPVASTTSLGSGKRTAIFPVAPTNLTNGTTYTVKVEARNAAGDSDPSSSLQATPCASCVVTQTANAAITLLSSNGTAQVTTGTCFPRSGDVTKPGGTTADPKVSCFQIPASVASAKAGSLVALRDEAPNPANGGDCPDPAHPCLGNQVSVAVPPGTGTNVQFTEVIIYDRTISTDVRGAPCTKIPCGNKYEYQVYMRPSIDVPAVLVGSSIPSTWCTKNTQTGLYNIPSGKPGCVVEYRTVNTSTNPSDNGNTSNGKQGNGDLRLTVVFWGDPRTAP